MTSDERLEAERLAQAKIKDDVRLKDADHYDQSLAYTYQFEGFLAGRESLRAKLKAERERSLKLRNFLKSIRSVQPLQALQTQFWIEVSQTLDEATRDE